MVKSRSCSRPFFYYLYFASTSSRAFLHRTVHHQLDLRLATKSSLNNNHHHHPRAPFSTISCGVVSAPSYFSQKYYRREGYHHHQKQQNPASSTALFLQKSSMSTKSTRSKNTSSSFVASAFHDNNDNNNDNGSDDAKIGISEIGNEKTTKEGTTKATADDEQPITSWREKINVSIARSRKIRGGNYVQIATVDPQTLEPRCRTIVFRGFLREMDQGKEEEGYVMKMITDLRSNKVSEITASSSPSSNNNNNNVELVWWFSESSEQYRIRGKLEYIGDPKSHSSEQQQKLPPPGDDDATFRYWSEQRKQQWGNLSDLAREQFYWVDPGVPYDNEGNSNDNIAIPAGGRDENGEVLEAPENFLLMILRPTYVDYLRLGDNFRQIDKLESDEEEMDAVDGGSTTVRKKWICERVNP